MSYIIAKYIRLSLDDAVSESASISTQRMILDKFIATMPNEDIRALEFVDNGYSGTNFQRPDVQKLLNMAAAGEIDCIIVKDFSRFGRNSIDTDYFIEKAFPIYGVRFISLGDGYDSEVQDAVSADLNFKFLINELYCKDLSQKISSAKAVRARRGELVSKNCAFGYKLDENRQMVIDDEAAETVRRIFALAQERRGPLEIARVLGKEKRLKPSAHKWGRGVDTEDAYIWSISVINSILANEQYTGMYVAGRTRTMEVGNKKRLTNPENEWIRIPDHHPAIISAEMFQSVQKPKRKKRPGSKKNTVEDTPLKGKVICACCGHVMHQRTGKTPSYFCGYTLPAPEASCHKLTISEETLSEQVLSQMKSWAEDALISRGQPGENTASRQANDVLDMCQLYEQFRAGAIDTEEFSRRKQSLSETKIRPRERTPDAHNMIHLATKAESLTGDLVDGLIERVLVQTDGSVRIVWHQEQPTHHTA